MSESLYLHMNVCGEYVCCVGMHGCPTQGKSWDFYLGDWRGGEIQRGIKKKGGTGWLAR